MGFKLKTRTMFPALVTVQSPLLLEKSGISYDFSIDVAELSESVAPLVTVEVLAGANTWTATQTISKNVTTPLPAIGTPSGVTGTAQNILTLAAADGIATDLFLQSFGSAAAVRYFSSSGTAAARTATTSGAGIAANFAYGYTGSAYVAVVGLSMTATETFSGSVSGARLDVLATPTGTTGLVITCSFGAGVMVGDQVDPGVGAVSATRSIKSKGATYGIGYATGAGGTQTQATSKSTAVALNTVCGLITMNNASLAAATIVSFVFTNSAIAATDMVLVTHESGGTLGAYTVNGRATGAGAGAIDVRNNTAGALGEAIVLRFAIIKTVNA